MNKEERYQRSGISAMVEDGLSQYKQTLKNILEQQIEELYGGGKDCPQCNEENEDAIIKIWDSAIEKCLEIVRAL